MDYPIQVLKKALSGKDKVYNILILGETGVGKSTMINAFANYFHFKSLDNAVKGNKINPVVAIPSKFTMNGQDISIGKPDANEVHDVGVSNTQGARTYPFHFAEYTINLIDTPGMGDTRGIKQDEANMENILNHLTLHDELHGILVLLKPNNARLGIVFEHCISELLTYLHKDAANIISFVFTNARSTFYQPGDTLPPLKKLLKDKKIGIDADKSNTFCFDNEAFRFMACAINGLKFDEDVTADYEKSWQRSVAEAERLLSLIKTSKPHQVKDTISLNDARRVILALSRPLNEFAEEIQRNIKHFEEQKKKASAFGSEAQRFAKSLLFDGVTIQHQTLDRPRTVCTEDSCVEYVEIGPDKIRQKDYKTHCHPQCYLEMVSVGTVGEEGLKYCAAMHHDVCKNCHHSFVVHMHIEYDLIRTKKRFISNDVQDQIKNIRSEKGKAEAEMKEVENLIKELREENSRLRETSMCNICMDSYNTPLVSKKCWHVSCEECWMRALGAKKLCPQCKIIIQPKDLRRIYL